MKNPLCQFFSLFILVSMTSVVFSDTTIETNVYKFTSKNGTPVFSDKVPPKRKFKKKSISVNQPEKKIEKEKKLTDQDIQKMLDKVYAQYAAKDKLFHDSISNHTFEKKPKKTSLKVCKGYKKKFDKVTEKMRIGYTASEYRGLETKRVKYRDLLFNECNSFDLI